MADYSPEQRQRNQRSIIVTTAIACAVVVVSGLMQSWSAGSYVAAFAVIAVLAVIFWALFAGRNARPLPTDRQHARWPYLSKKKLDENIKNNIKR